MSIHGGGGDKIPALVNNTAASTISPAARGALKTWGIEDLRHRARACGLRNRDVGTNAVLEIRRQALRGGPRRE
jgi:hypothetical protein